MVVGEYGVNCSIAETEDAGFVGIICLIEPSLFWLISWFGTAYAVALNFYISSEEHYE